MEAGLIEKWKNVYWPSDDECAVTARGGQGSSTTVTVTDMQGSFFILGIGKEDIPFVFYRLKTIINIKIIFLSYTGTNAFGICTTIVFS